MGVESRVVTLGVGAAAGWQARTLVSSGGFGALNNIVLDIGGAVIVRVLIRLVKRGVKVRGFAAAVPLVLVLAAGIDNGVSAQTGAECARLLQSIAKEKERVEAIRQEQEVAYQNAPARTKAAAKEARDRFYATWYYPRVEKLKADEEALKARCKAAEEAARSRPPGGKYYVYQRGFDGNTLAPTREVTLVRTQQGYLLTTPDGRYTLVPGVNGQFTTRGVTPPVSVEFVRQNDSPLGFEVYDVYFRPSGGQSVSETWSLK